MHKETISSEIKNALAALIKINDVKDFYLAGGTAVVLQLGHRQSVDLDFFTEKDFNPDGLLKKLIKHSEFTVDRKEAGTLTGQWKNVRLEFFNYPYPLIKKTIKWRDIKIASLEDIALMKLTAIASRGTKKDFFDLFEICNKIISLEKIFFLLPKKFKGAKYDVYHLLKSLAYFEDADNDPDPNLIKVRSWQEVKRFFLKQVSLIKLD